MLKLGAFGRGGRKGGGSGSIIESGKPDSIWSSSLCIRGKRGGKIGMGWREGSIFCYMKIMSYSLFLGGIFFLRVCFEHATQIACWELGRAFLISLIAGTVLSTPIHWERCMFKLLGRTRPLKNGEGGINVVLLTFVYDLRNWILIIGGEVIWI